MKINYHLTLAFLLINSIANCQVTGRLLDRENFPIKDVLIMNTSAKTFAYSDQDGKFTIIAAVSDVLEFYIDGSLVFKILVDNPNMVINQMLHKPELAGAGLGGGGTLSPKNFWLGAKVGYNFLADTKTNNYIIGSASINLNLYGKSTGAWTFGVIGDIGNFKFNQDTTENKNIQNLAQSINGLSLGLGLTHQQILYQSADTIKDGTKPTSYFREFLLTGGRFNSFTNVGTASSTVNLGQSVTSFGLEFEQTGFINGGSLDLSTSVSLLLFDKGLYNEVFNESKGSLVTYDITAILPISKNIGAYFDGTFLAHSSPLFLLGIVLKQ